MKFATLFGVLLTLSACTTVPQKNHSPPHTATREHKSYGLDYIL